MDEPERGKGEGQGRKEGGVQALKGWKGGEGRGGTEVLAEALGETEQRGK